MTVHYVAREYLQRGWAPLPVPYQAKRPTLKGWQNLRIGEDELPHHFNGQAQNVGILLGEPSGWLVDVDLDHPAALELADDYLPKTGAVFGRESAPASHRLYRATGPIETAKHQTEAREMLVELRSTGCQTIAPGSVHESGEPIRWDSDDAPAEVDPHELAEVVERLAHAAAERAGVRLRQKRKPHRPVPVVSGSIDRAWRYIEKMPDAISGQGGHDATFRAACECFRFGLSDAEARQLMDRFNAEKCDEKWTERELDHKLNGARERVQADGEVGIRVQDSAEPAKPVDSSRLKSDEGYSQHQSLTDLGNAERFAEQHGRRVMFCWATGQWFVWRKTHWAEDTTGEVFRLVSKTARSIYREASQCTNDDLRPKLAKWAHSSEARSRLDAMIALARSHERIAVDVQKLDSDPWLFNCKSGTIDLRSGELKPHDPADLITRCSPVKYEPEATPGRWIAFLERIFDGDDGLIGFVQRVLGMALSGDVSEQFLFIFHGQGANGKSVALDTIGHIMGEYYGAAAPDLLVSSKHGEHPTELADLQGRRLVVGSETEANAPLRLQLVKRLTGDSTIKARRMRQDYYEFPRTHKLVLVTNNRPRVQEDSEAVWRRLRLVPFHVVIPEPERDPYLLDKLKAEAPAILGWLVAGCLDWQREGLGEPEAVTRATEAYREESDPLADFLADCCQTGPNVAVASGELRRAYEAHCERNGAKPLGQTRFREAMKAHGFEPGRNWQGRVWQGLMLIDADTMTPHDATTRFPREDYQFHREPGSGDMPRHGAGDGGPNWWED